MFKYLFLVICVVIWLFVYGLFNDDVNTLDYERSSSCLQLQVEMGNAAGKENSKRVILKQEKYNPPPPPLLRSFAVFRILTFCFLDL